MKTYPDSFWADLYTSFPLLDAEAGDRDLHGTTACVLGCSDGKFVIPLAAAGCTVTCVDVDPTMIDGGTVRYRGEDVRVAGLKANLASTGLTERCRIILADYMEEKLPAKYDFVLTSGSWAYNRNLRHGLAGVVEVMKRAVAPAGYLFADYLLPVTEQEYAIDLYPQPERLQEFFPPDRWRTVHNKEVGLIGESHYGQEELHQHNYGALLVQRKA